MSRKRNVEEENRSFDEQWIENYLFYENRKDLPSCLVCGYSCPVNKEYNVRRHYETTHAGKYGELAGRERSEEVRKLLSGLKRQQDASRLQCRKVKHVFEEAIKSLFSLQSITTHSLGGHL